METETRDRKGVLAVNVGLAANAILAAVKTLVGVVGHSSALLADGINSTSDVAYYVVVRVFIHFSRKPADEEHPYGHTQLESIAALVVGAFVMTTAIAIFWGAVNDVYDLACGAAPAVETRWIALWIALATVGVKIALLAFTRGIGRETGNAAVVALAEDHRNDIFSAAGAAVGIFASRVGYPWGDPLAGAVVALLVMRTGIRILRESSATLMDTVPGRLLDEQARAVAARIPGIQAVEEVLGHRFGPYFVLNVTVGVDGALNVAEGDRIASRLEQVLCAEVPFVRRVYIHYHPAGRRPLRAHEGRQEGRA